MLVNASALRCAGAVQLGLMALDGYEVPYAPDWAVTSIVYVPSDPRFPFHVRGINLNVPPGEYGHLFSWRVPALCWRYRFELCAGGST